MSWFNLPSFLFHRGARRRLNMTTYELFVDDLKQGGYTVINTETVKPHYDGDHIKVILYHTNGPDTETDTTGLTSAEVLKLNRQRVVLADCPAGIKTELGLQEDYDGPLRYLPCR
jgi:hypothetical protein